MIKRLNFRKINVELSQIRTKAVGFFQFSRVAGYKSNSVTERCTLFELIRKHVACCPPLVGSYYISGEALIQSKSVLSGLLTVICKLLASLGHQSILH